MNGKITGNQMQSLLILFWTGSILVVASNQSVKKDFWVSILASAFFMLPMIALYCRLLKLYPGKSLYEILFEVFGGPVGRMITFLFVVFALFLGELVLSDCAFFIQVTATPETPRSLVDVLFILVTILATASGVEVLGRVAKGIIYLAIGFVYFSTLVCVSTMKISNILPVLNTDFKSMLGASAGVFLLPFAEVILCLPFFSALEKGENAKKIFLKAFFITLLTFTIVAARNVLVLGTSADYFYSPSYAAISTASVGEFFSRFEILVGIDLVLVGLVKICICTFAASTGLSKILNIKEQKTLVVPCALIILVFQQFGYGSANSILVFVPVFPLIAAPFELILPVIILIAAEIRYRMNLNPGKRKA